MNYAFSIYFHFWEICLMRSLTMTPAIVLIVGSMTMLLRRSVRTVKEYNGSVLSRKKLFLER